MGWRVVTRTIHLLDDLRGEPERPGVPARPGVMVRLQAITTEMTALHAQVIPNGGASLRDAVDRVSADVTMLAADLTEHRHTTSPAIRQLGEDVGELRKRMEQFEHERFGREEGHV
jgi:hypothetical protein